jgi:hypothetical protein
MTKYEWNLIANLVRSSVSINNTIIYGLDDRGSIPDRSNEEIVSLCHRAFTGSLAHLASYSVDTEGSFLGGKALGA